MTTITIPATIEKLTLTDAEWKDRLDAETFRVMRHEGTEPPMCSRLNAEKRSGIYHCAACDLPLFSSEAKYESRSGWPSFFQPIAPQVLETTTDFKIGYPRTEVHCARCEGHLGHVFDDGPAPTGRRYCMNGVAMAFKAEDRT